MARVSRSKKQPDQPASEGPVALWERINALMDSRGVRVQDLADAAEVTWAAAKRWTKPPPPRGDGATPNGANLAAIARRLGVTVEELLRAWDGEEPDHPSFQDFKATNTYSQLTPEQLRRVCMTPLADDEEPTIETWIAAANVQLTTKRRAS